MISKNELTNRLSWPLDLKIEWFIKRFYEFFLEFDGEVYLSYSGGKDSDVGTDIIDKIWDGTFKHLIPGHIYKKVISFEKPELVFCNTGLEFPEIVLHVKKKGLTWGGRGLIMLKPKMGFTRVIKEIGVAVGSKKIASTVERLKKYLASPTANNLATRTLYLTGIRRDGEKSKTGKLSTKWMKLLDAPFNVTDQCCNIFKKEPFKLYQKENRRKPVVFTTTSESGLRVQSYLQTGCNSFESGKQKSRPFSIFTEANVWEYADRFKLRFCEVYYERTNNVEQLDGSFKLIALEAEKRTGCTFCLFGIHLEDKKKNNRIQRLGISHPKYYDIVVNKCGLGDILKWLKIAYIPMLNFKCGKGKQQELF